MPRLRPDSVAASRFGSETPEGPSPASCAGLKYFDPADWIAGASGAPGPVYRKLASKFECYL